MSDQPSTTPDSNSNPSPSDQNVTPATAPTTPTPAAPSTDGNALRSELQNLQLGALRDLHAENARLQAMLAERNATPSTQPQSDDVAAFLSNPRQAIRDELEQVIAPLKQFVGAVKQKDAYTEMKDQFKATPQLGKLLADHEDIVDQLMQNSELTPGNMQAAIFAAVGMKAAGVVGGPPTTTTPPVNTPPNNPTPPVNNNPPYIPPSPPAPPRQEAPKNDLKSKVDALTEQERHIAKTFSMSLEEYVQLRDADSNVSSWQRPGGSQ